MRLVVGTATGGQVKNTKDRVRVIEFHARSDNKNSVYVGTSDVSATNGRELVPGESVTFRMDLAIRDGSVTFDTFHTSVSGSGKVDFSALTE